MSHKLALRIANILSLLFLAFHLSLLLLFEPIYGWDFYPQYYLINRALENFQKFDFTSYDFNWLAGYSEFKFYAPGFYILVAALDTFLVNPVITLFTPEKKTIIYTFHSLVFFLPFLLIFSLKKFAFYIASPSASNYIIPISVFFFLSSSRMHIENFGVYGSLFHGHLPNFLALIFFLNALTFLFIFKTNKKTYYLLFFSIFLALVIYTHTLTTIALFFFLLISMFFLDFKQKIYAAFFTLFGLILCAPWLIPFSKDLWLTASRAIGMGHKKTIYSLFPESMSLLNCKGGVLDIVLSFPYHLALIFALCVSGIYQVILKKNYLLIVSFFLPLVLISRDYLFDYLNFPIHYYRYVFVIVLFYIVILAEGASYFFKLKSKTIQVVSLVLILLSSNKLILKVNYFYSNHFNEQIVKIEDSCKTNESYQPAYPLKTNSFYGLSDAREVIEYLKNNEIAGRIAIETTNGHHSRLGSPHYLSTSIASELGIPVIPGLLVESSLSSRYFNSVLTLGSHSIRWGNVLAMSADSNYKNPMDLLDLAILRLSQFGVTRIIASSDLYKSNLNVTNLVEVEFINKEFSIYKYKQKSSLGLSVKNKPWLYIGSRAGFINLSDILWFSSFDFDNLPILFDPSLNINNLDLNRFGGIIIDARSKYRVKNNFDKFKDFNKILLLEEKEKRNILKYVSNNTKIVFSNDKLKSNLLSFLNMHAKVDKDYDYVEVKESRERLSFSSNSGTLLKYTYAPEWKVLNNPKEKIYLSMPSFMFLFANGETSLEY